MTHWPLTSVLMLGVVSASPGAPAYCNPVLAGDWPDPFVLKTTGGYFLWATNSERGNVPTAHSTNLVDWVPGPDAMPYLAPWVVGGHTWAPEVLAIGNRYLMYYTARDRESGLQAIGVAEASSPDGPFVDSRAEPLVNEVEEGGSIDASPFRDRDGTLYLLWKNDGNAVGMLCNLSIARLSSDGTRLTSDPVGLISNDALWEGTVVEAPTLYEKEGWYYLLYSASAFDSDLYGVGAAVARSPLGPFEKLNLNPILASRSLVAGPGHQCLVLDDAGQTWLVYHAWAADRVGYGQKGVRSVRLDRIDFGKGTISFQGPTTDPQPEPFVRATSPQKAHP